MVCSQHKPKNKTKTKTKKSKKKNKRNRKKERKKGCKKVQSGYSQLKLKSHCCLFFLVHLFHFILFIYVFCSFGFLSNTCLDVHKANNNETLYVHIVTNITQRKINIQQLTACQLEERYYIPKNKLKKRMLSSILVSHFCFILPSYTVTKQIMCLTNLSTLPSIKILHQ